MEARTWKVNEVPIPYLSNRQHYVSNPDQILQASTVDSINRRLYALEIDKGVQTLVLVLDKIENNDPYEFSMAIARKYGVGSKQQHTGLIILLAKGDRSYYFLTGRGLEGTLPDALIQRLENRIFIPQLKAGNWDQAMLLTITAIDRICRGDKSLLNEKQELPTASTQGLFFYLFLIIIAIFLIVISKNRKDKNNTHRGNKSDSDSGLGLLLLTALANSHRHRGGGFGGGGFSGGSFGGGSFGGGGSGGRF